MTDWFVNINLRKESKEQYSPIVVKRVIYRNIETKKEVLEKLKDDFPEYFSKKVPQRTSKEEYFYCTIYPYTGYWKEYWEEEIFCKECGEHPKTRFSLKENDCHERDYFCSDSCRHNYQERKAIEDNTYYNIEGVGYIYKITHKPTGKIYIGKTKNHPIWRWWQHLKAQGDNKFYKVMKRSKLTEWTFECLEVCEGVTDDELLAKESYYIAKYNATDDKIGFNTRL